MKSPENSSSHQQMPSNEEHSPPNNLPTDTETGGHDSQAVCSKENLEFSQKKDSARWNSSVNAGGSSESSDTCKLAPENPKKICRVEALGELPKMTTVGSIDESSFNSFLLYQEVTSRGGYEQVTKMGRWREVASALNLKIETPNLTFLLGEIYLFLLEQMYILTMQQQKAEDTGTDLRRAVTGRIKEKIGNSYLITVQVGSEELNGLLCGIEECHDNWLSLVSQIGKIAGSDLDPELYPDSLYKAFGKPKSKGSQNKKATKKDPHAPRRARSSFAFFLKEHLKKKHLRTNRKMVTDVWNSLSLNEQLPYTEASRKEKESCKLKSSPDARKKARNAYEIFYSEQVRLLKKLEQSEIMKKAASIWKSLSENEKLPYIEEHLKDKERHKLEMAAYKELKESQCRNIEDQLRQPELTNDDCYHVSLQTEQQQTEEYFMKDEPTTEEQLIKNEDLLDASQMMGWELFESVDTTA